MNQKINMKIFFLFIVLICINILFYNIVIKNDLEEEENVN